jgi:hypothetical protein
LSEQKRRESINSGFLDLKAQVTSPRITRALSLNSRHPSEIDSDAKLASDTKDTVARVLGSGGRESKAAVLRKACKVIESLANKTFEMQSEIDSLHSQLGKTSPKKGRHSKRGSRDVAAAVPADILAQDDEDMKMEETQS